MKIKVIDVHKDRLMLLAGLPWAEAVRQVVDRIVQAEITEVLHLNSKQKPPADHAYLREVDGRAFLYYQNF